jgi:phytoene synthase
MPPDEHAGAASAALVRQHSADVAACRRILARGSKSFWAASLLLPRRVRGSAASFYAFCRVADDAVDETDDPDRAVEDLTTRIDAVYRGMPHDDPVDRALSAIVERHEIPRAPIDALIDGFVWDAKGRRYEELSDVLAYSARVASAVGVVMTYIMGSRDRQTLARACDLGAAMQLTNICRDVGEDARRGRVYLPGAWLRSEGIEPEDLIANPEFSPAVATAVKRLLEEAARLYDRARAGIAMLPADCRPAIRAASWIYADIGRVIAERGYDSVSARAYTSALRKVSLGLRAWFTRHDDQAMLGAPALQEVEFLVAGAR